MPSFQLPRAKRAGGLNWVIAAHADDAKPLSYEKSRFQSVGLGNDVGQASVASTAVIGAFALKKISAASRYAHNGFSFARRFQHQEDAGLECLVCASHCHQLSYPGCVLFFPQPSDSTTKRTRPPPLPLNNESNTSLGKACSPSMSMSIPPSFLNQLKQEG